MNIIFLISKHKVMKELYIVYKFYFDWRKFVKRKVQDRRGLCWIMECGNVYDDQNKSRVLVGLSSNF